MPKPKNEITRERVRALLRQERWRSASVQDLSEEANAARSIVMAVAREMGLPKPHFHRHDKSLRLSPRERDLLAQGDHIATPCRRLEDLLRSEPARNLHRVVIAARARG